MGHSSKAWAAGDIDRLLHGAQQPGGRVQAVVSVCSLSRQYVVSVRSS